jgi:WD40 repeat protein
VLEDRDGDGRYESSRVFADGLVFPMGLAWRDGRLYVADPPDLVALEDRDSDGRADRRTAILTGFGHVDNGSLHGLPHGETLASGDRSGVVKLWDMAVRDEVQTLEPHAGPVRSMQFSADGKALATCADRSAGIAEVFLRRAAGDHIFSAADPGVRSVHRH